MKSILRLRLREAGVTEKNIKIAAIQMASGPSVAGNLAEATVYIKKAVRAGAKVIVLPENFAFVGETEQEKLRVAEEFGSGTIQDYLSHIAADQRIWIFAGSIAIKADGDKVYSALLVYNPDGLCVARYDKIHLFGFTHGTESYQESRTILSGEQAVVLELPFGNVALGICYDIRFPELFRAMHPFNILILPAAFTAITGRAHWELLVRTRAVENLAFVVTAAQGGFHLSGRETYGDSMIVDPWGQVLARLPKGTGFIAAATDLQQQADIRHNLPALEHRQF